MPNMAPGAVSEPETVDASHISPQANAIFNEVCCASCLCARTCMYCTCMSC